MATRGCAWGILGELGKFSFYSSFHITDAWLANYLRCEGKRRSKYVKQDPKAEPSNDLMRGEKNLCNIQQPQRHLLFMQNNKETIKNRLECGMPGKFIWIFKPWERSRLTFAELQRFFQTMVEVVQQERPNPQSVMKSRRRIKHGGATALLAAVREEGSGLGVW